MTGEPERAAEREQQHDPSYRAWLRHAGPMLAVAFIPVADLAIPPRTAHPIEAAIAIVATVALFVTWLVEWRISRYAGGRLDAWYAYAFLAIVALWREAEGGSLSGYGPLVLGPLVFLALHGTRRQLLAGIAGIGAVFIGPVYLLDDADYPQTQELRRATIWILSGLVSGLAIHRLVTEASLARRTTELVLERLPGTVIILFDRNLRHIAVHGQGSGTEDGIPWQSVVGSTPRGLFGPRASRFEQELLLTIQGKPREFEWTSTSGKRVHLISTSPWHATSPDDPAAGVMVIRDVTESVHLARDLDRERAFLRAVLDNMQDGVAAIDSTGNEPVLNDALREMLGLEHRTGLAGQDWLDMLRDPAGQPIPQDRTPLRRALTGEDIRREPLAVVTPDGEQREFEATAAPILLYGDAVLGSVMTLHDVTARREADRMKDQFFALVSHELRTPLAAIIGYLELLDEEEHDNLSEDGREFVSVMQRNSQRLMRLIGDLLFAAQVEAGTLTLVTGQIDLADVARAAYDTARVRAAERGQVVELSLEPADRPIPYVGDRDRLGQVLDNLLTNAIKFTPDGGRIEIRVVEGDGDVCLEVADTGRGIPEAEQARLFERFARARSADEDAVQGVGLGLAITKAIVEAHGGEIQLRSTVGEGTTFIVELPTLSSAYAPSA